MYKEVRHWCAYLGSFEKFIQDLGQRGVRMNSKLDVLRDGKDYELIQAIVGALYMMLSDKGRCKVITRINCQKHSLGHEFLGRWRLTPHGWDQQRANPKCEPQEFRPCQIGKSTAESSTCCLIQTMWHNYKLSRNDVANRITLAIPSPSFSAKALVLALKLVLTTLTSNPSLSAFSLAWGWESFKNSLLSKF